MMPNNNIGSSFLAISFRCMHAQYMRATLMTQKKEEFSVLTSLFLSGRV